MKKRPVIGVCPAWNAADRQILLLASYADALILNGALPILPPIGDCLEEVLDDFLARCDGLLVTGGEDLEPAFYGAERHPACGPTVPERDQFDKLLFTRDFFSISKTTKHKIKAEIVSIIAKVEASEKFKVFFTD